MQLEEVLQLIEKTYNHIENKKNCHISLSDQQSYYLQVFQIFYQPQKEDQQGSSF